MNNLFFAIAITLIATSTAFAQSPNTTGRQLNAPKKAATTAPATTMSADTSAPKIQSRTRKTGQTGQPEVVQRQMKDRKGNATAQEFRRRQPDAYRCNAPLYDRDFQYAFVGLRDNRRGNQDYNITQFVHRNCLTTDQIAQLGGLYRDDADRLLFVFDAFSYCYDFDSYDILINLFRQPTHITKFNDFIYDNLYEPTGGGYYGYNNGGYNWYGTEQGVGDSWTNYNSNGYNNSDNGYNPPRNDPYFNPNAGSFEGNNGGGGRGNNGGNGGGRGNTGGGRGNTGNNTGGGRGNDGYNGGGHNYNDYNNNYAPQAMSNQDFNAARGTIERTTFEDTRLQIAKQILSANLLNTNQIMDICRLFTFEDRRLDFAKAAYSRCTDPQNYYRVGEIFTFNSNTAALSNFVTSNPRQAQYAPNEGNNNGYNNNDNYNNNGYNNNGYNNNNQNNNANAGVNDSDFQSIRKNIKNQTTESTKLQVAKQICENRYFTADQIAQLARLFAVESKKFDFAKAAYPRCIDPLNYYKVNEVFTVQSYVRDLTEFVRGR